MLQPCKQTQFPLLVPEKTKKPDGCDLASPFGKKDTPFAFLLLDVTLLRDIQTVKKLLGHQYNPNEFFPVFIQVRNSPFEYPCF